MNLQIASIGCTEPAVEAALATRLPSLFVVGRCQMLKVTVLSGGTECRTRLERRLFSPWVSKLESAWEMAQQAASGKKIAVDLSGITLIDSNGKAVLMNMIGQGTKLVARGIYNQPSVEELKSRARAAGAARIVG